MEVVKQIAGKKRGFRFSMLTFQLFSDHTGVSFGDIMEHMKEKTLGSIVVLFWAANTVYCKGKNGNVSRYDVDEWIAQMSQEDMQEIWDCFLESTKVMINNLPKVDGKKK